VPHGVGAYALQQEHKMCKRLTCELKRPHRYAKHTINQSIVVGTVEPDVKIADDVDGHLVGGESIENVNQLVEELLLHRLGAGSLKNDDDD